LGKTRSGDSRLRGLAGRNKADFIFNRVETPLYPREVQEGQGNAVHRGGDEQSLYGGPGTTRLAGKKGPGRT